MYVGVHMCLFTQQALVETSLCYLRCAAHQGPTKHGSIGGATRRRRSEHEEREHVEEVMHAMQHRLAGHEDSGGGATAVTTSRSESYDMYKILRTIHCT